MLRKNKKSSPLLQKSFNDNKMGAKESLSLRIPTPEHVYVLR